MGSPQAAKSASVLPLASSRGCVRVAVDLTALSRRTDDGVRALAEELVSALPPLAHTWQFLLLTSPGDDLPALPSANVRRVVVHNGEVLPASSWLTRVRPVLVGVRRLASVAMRFWFARKPATVPLARALGAHVLLCPLGAPSCYDPAVPTVVVLSDLTHRHYPELFSSKRRAKRDRALRETVRVASRIVCVSEHVCQTVVKQSAVESGRMATMPAIVSSRAPVLPDATVSRVLTRFGLGGKRFLLCPAPFTVLNNHALLLTAMGMHRVERPATDLRLVLAGKDSAEGREIRQAVDRMDLGSHIVQAPDVSTSELVALLRACAAVVFPSLYEEFGVWLVQAMTLGKPILCSNTPGVREVVGDAGIYFDPRKPLELVNVIDRLDCGEIDAAEVQERARERLKERGDSARMARAYLRLLQDALAEPSPPRDSLDGVYADGWTAERFCVRFRAGESPRTLQLTLQSPPVGSGRARLRLVVNGQAGGHRGLKPGELYELRRLLPCGGGYVEIEVEPVFHPREHGFGADPRTLGCLCKGCRLTDARGHRDLLREAIEWQGAP